MEYILDVSHALDQVKMKAGDASLAIPKDAIVDLGGYVKFGVAKYEITEIVERSPAKGEWEKPHD